MLVEMNETVLTGLLWFAAFLFSTTVHEAMHALAAYRGGDTTAYLGGQVSLSPLPHIRREPIGMLVVPLLTAFTLGWAVGWASTPYDPHWAARHPRRAAGMAADDVLDAPQRLLVFAVEREQHVVGQPLHAPDLLHQLRGEGVTARVDLHQRVHGHMLPCRPGTGGR